MKNKPQENKLTVAINITSQELSKLTNMGQKAQADESTILKSLIHWGAVWGVLPAETRSTLNQLSKQQKCTIPEVVQKLANQAAGLLAVN